MHTYKAPFWSCAGSGCAVSMFRGAAVCRTATTQVMGARRLLPAWLSGRSDPYCVVSVGSQQLRTRVLPNTKQPEWRESFSFRGTEVTQASNVVSFEVLPMGLSSEFSQHAAMWLSSAYSQ